MLITDVVLVETIWTLKGKRYNLERESIIKVINSLFEEPNIKFEDGQIIWQALSDYKNAKPIKSGGKNKEADFPAAVIVNKARIAVCNAGFKFRGVYTFDVAAQQIPGL